MQFKVGDRVIGTCNYDGNPIKGVKGTVASVEGNPLVGVHFDKDIGGHICSIYSKPCKNGHGYYVPESCLSSIANNKILITSDGTTTLAQLYDGEKIVKSAEAKCSPSDTFNFNTGAQLAYNRLMYGTDYNPAEVAFKPEPVKLYCVKDYSSLFGLTKGKIYQIDAEGKCLMDGEPDQGDRFVDFEDFAKRNPSFAACLVPLVKRPAKVGEWVLITNANYTFGDYKNGDVLRSDAMRGNKIDKYGVESGVHIGADEYLVLDGYQPEPPKPEYYNGKVVCIEKKNDFLTAGKVYAFTDGKSVDDNGRSFPRIGKFESLDDLNDTMWSQFIPYLGERLSMGNNHYDPDQWRCE